MLEITDYCPEFQKPWDEIAEQADNGHFMFKRSYMDYHADRFTDASLVVLSKGRPIGICPANRTGEEWRSHGGLTFGGLCLRPKFNRIKNIESLSESLCDLLSKRGFKRVHVKPVPWIYHKVPAEGEIYFLNRLGQATCTVEISTTIDLLNLPKASSSREWMKRKAHDAGFYVESSDDFEGFWNVLGDRLKQKYDRNPVHSVEEIKFLAGRFPENIGLFVVRDGGRNIVGGTVMFLNSQVAHTQYLAASEDGMGDGALDLLVFYLIDFYQKRGQRYFDFGISNEQNGKVLNSSLATFKEGFGGRSIVHHKFDFDL
ncbi:MAG: GNAT family N-acetyltransferase [Thalassospira sp.]|uniref:GNAT family N-acetyltransferase n=1 Tax=Thalassospira sp. TaxID=1912094 RepID=UPI000C4416B0|nr:GNAT family N-acetyltransferase [Thalassospira sp.]MAZ33303.1 GNAT family N-acetyltransferase [Thalassospira sp.]